MYRYLILVRQTKTKHRTVQRLIVPSHVLISLHRIGQLPLPTMYVLIPERIQILSRLLLQKPSVWDIGDFLTCCSFIWTLVFQTTYASIDKSISGKGSMFMTILQREINKSHLTTLLHQSSQCLIPIYQGSHEPI